VTSGWCRSYITEVDLIDDAQLTTSRSMEPFQFESERLAHPLRILGDRSIDELKNGW
jgi:hypothetical protein